MERRVLLAFFLSFLVLYAYQAVFVPSPPESSPAAAPAPGSTALALGGAPARDAQTADRTAEPGPPGRSEIATAPAIAPPIVTADAAREIVVDSPAFSAVFTNRGAELVSWKLKNYFYEGTDSPIDLIPQELPEEEPSPFALVFADTAVTAHASEALYRATRDGRPLAEGTGELRLTDRATTLIFDYEEAGGLRVSKRFHFDPADPFVVTVTIDATLGGQPQTPVIRWGPALGGVESSSSGFAYRVGPRGVLFGGVRQPDGRVEEDVERPDGAASYGGFLQFVGIDNHYFIAAAMPGDGVETAVSYRAVPQPPLTDGGDVRSLMAFDLAFPDDDITDVPFFLGPKDFEILEAAHASMVRSIEFGWFGWLVMPLHRSLTWVHDYVGNWGWSIIFLTFLINIVIFPLKHKSVMSMRKMQEVQPEMKAIQERYKHLKTTDPDKQKMNQEIMALYRDRGVNPASGCLPMLLTMPVLFAFYRLLSMSIEIRGEPFVGWITDLAVRDPLFVLPAFMGASMVVQQRMTPTQADPMQQKIMMFMPIMFTVMMGFAPAGLVLYWMTSNVIQIGQQFATNKIIGPPKIRTVRPAAERRVNKTGGPKKASA